MARAQKTQRAPEGAAAAVAEAGPIDPNIAAVHEFYTREDLKLGASQRHAERIGRFVGRPAFLAVILLFVTAWVVANLLLPRFGLAVFDEAPFFWLQGIVALSALLTTTVVLARQNRMARLAAQRAHLDLKVLLLIEQKTAKLIDLLEELRRDLPNVKDRHDSGAAVLQQALSPEVVLAVLHEAAPSPDRSSTPAPVAATDPPVP